MPFKNDHLWGAESELIGDKEGESLFMRNPLFVQNHHDVSVYSTVGDITAVLVADLQHYFRFQGSSVSIYH